MTGGAASSSLPGPIDVSVAMPVQVMDSHRNLARRGGNSGLAGPALRRLPGPGQPEAGVLHIRREDSQRSPERNVEDVGWRAGGADGVAGERQPR